MNNSKILILTEGKSPDKSVIQNINEKFDIGGEIIWTKVGTIYAFYKLLKKEYEKTPYIEMASYIKTRYKSKISEDFLSSQISRIYLFFDYDIYSELDSEYDDLEKISEKIKEIEEISKFFANETEEGKLYLSFPMIEAYSKPVGVNFKYRKENFEELLKNFSNFKSKIKKETRNRGNACINSKYLEIIKFYIENSKKLLDLKIEEIERIKVLEFENNLLKNNRKINVFSGIPIFLKEYFGMKKLNKILIEKSKKES